MSDSREPTCVKIKLPEWRQTSKPLSNSLSKKQMASKPKAKARWKDHRLIREIVSESQDGSYWAKRKGPTPEVSLESLGTDLWFLISPSLRKVDLLAICQTSSSLHAQVIPVLYHTIDVSTHAPPDGVTISFRHRRRTYERQYLFKRQITMNPEYGQHVRSLKWTIGVEYGQVWSLPLDEFGYRTPTSSDGERVVWRSENVGILFELLTRVVKLDIQWPKRHLSDLVEREIHEPKSGGRSTTMTEGNYVTDSSFWRSQTVNSEQRDAQKMIDSTSAAKEESVGSLILFPNVQSVNLRGTVDALPILSGANNVAISFLQLGPYSIARPDFSGLTTRTSRPSTSISTAPRFINYPDILHPSFQLRCKGLHTLSVTIQHTETSSPVQDFYTSIAAFLLNIRPRSFVFSLIGMNGKPLPQPKSGHLQHEGPECPKCRRPRVIGTDGRLEHMNYISGLTSANIIPKNFQRTLLPVLSKGWEGLQRVEVKGVMKALLVEMRLELEAKGVELTSDGWDHD